MRFVSTDVGPGVWEDDGSVGLFQTTCRDVTELLRSGLSSSEIGRLPVRARIGPDDVQLAPVVRPMSLWAQGGGYVGHLRANEPRPARPRFFLIAPSSVVASGAAIVLPPEATEEVDYEGEVAVVVGRPMRNAAVQHVWDHVAGLTLMNDVSARDVQRGRNAHAPGIDNVAVSKSFDTFSPLGPAMTTLDSFPDLERVPLSTFVDGELRQEGTTAELVFGIPELLAILSSYVTLFPGDVLSTGTPTGVGEASGAYLRAGSTVTVTSPLIGTLSNPVVASEDTASPALPTVSAR